MSFQFREEDELRPEDIAAMERSVKEAAGIDIPADFQPLVPEPDPTVTPGVAGPRYREEPLYGEESEEEEVVLPEPEASIHGFPLEVQNDVDGLMWLGYLEDSFSFAGHKFTIRTLRGEEELLAGLVVKKYIGSIDQAKAWAWAKVALCLVAVDGDPYFCLQSGPDKLAYAERRFEYVTNRWYWPVGAYILTRYAELIERQEKAIEAIQNLS